MDIRTAHSTRSSVDEAVREIALAFDGAEPRAVLFFASSAFEPAAVSRRMQDAFPGAHVFGCTTSGELVGGPDGGRMLKGSVVAMALGDDVVGDLCIEVIDLSAPDGVQRAFRRFEAHYGASMLEMDPSRYVGFVLIDGLSVQEERVNERIGDLTNVYFIGGSAGDDLKFETTHVLAGGQAYRNAAVLALLRPKVGFDFVKTQSFRVLDRQLVPTRVDEASRQVFEFDGAPAAQAYAAAVDCPVEAAGELFMQHPVGLMVGDEPFVRSPQRFDGDSIVFYCDVKEGMPLQLLESKDIVEDTRKALRDKAEEMGGFSAVVNFHCILRTLELESKRQTDAYGALFSEVPTVGFSTYGESFIGHINQTSTMLVFGREPLA